MKGRGASTTAIIMACVLALLAAGCSGAAPTGAAGSAEPASVSPVPSNVASYEPGELIVGLSDKGADGAAADAARRAIESTGATVTEVLTRASDYAGTTLLVSTDADHRTGDALAQAAEAIAGQGGISYVQPNYHYATAAAKAADVASDKDVDKQYYLNDWDSSRGANVAAAWSGVGSDEKVGVAVLDTGVYVMQERDSKGNLRTASSIDRDGFDISDNFHQEFDAGNLDLDHAVDFVHTGEGDGASLMPLVNEDNPYGDDNGHGTHIAGIIAANAKTAQNPGALPIGMAGVSQNARIIPVKVLDAAGEGSTEDFIRAYDYLISNKDELNLHVVNMSLALSIAEGDDDEDGDDDEGDEDLDLEDGEREAGADTWYDDKDHVIAEHDEPLYDESADDADGGADDPSLEADVSLKGWIDEARNAGIVTVCAIGNKADDDNRAYTSYPSAYGNCISVAALDESGKVADYSIVNDDVDVCAPGSGIYSTWGSQADAYATFDGTSQATAIVSGILSMMWAHSPDLTVERAERIIEIGERTVTVQREALLVGASAAGSDAFEAATAGTLSAGTLATSSGSDKAATETKTFTLPVVDAVAAVGTANREILSVDMVTLESASLAYTGKERTPAVTVKAGDITLAQGTDYTVEYANNTNVTKKATVTVRGKGGYAGTVQKTFAITAADLSSATTTLPATSYTYTGKALKPTVTVKANGVKLIQDTDYTVAYANNTNVSTTQKMGTVTVTGKGNYTGTVRQTFTIEARKLTSGMVSLSATSFAYNGKERKPTPTVKVGGEKVAASNYTVTYKNNKSVGTATAIVKGRNNLGTQTVKVTFRIVPKATTLSKVTAGAAGSKSFTAQWKKQATQTTGYQLRYSLKKNMTGTTAKTVAKNATTKLTVSKLKKGKTYYVQVRTYRKVGSATYYSSWSAAKAVKVR